MSLPDIKIYTGTLDRLKMTKDSRYGYENYNGQKARSKKSGLPAPAYSTREYIGWWLNNLKSFKGAVASCGRIDNSKGYSFDNIEMQDMADNSREGMLRNKTHIKSSIKYGKKILVRCKNSKEVIAEISSIRDAARLFDVSQRLVQFIIRGKYKQSSKINFILEVK